MDAPRSPEVGEELPVQVLLRLRPLTGHRETVVVHAGPRSLKICNPVQTTSANGEAVIVSKRLEYTFDWVLPESSSQMDTFKKSCPSMIRHFLGGNNALLFCYGPSASGKTFTIQGDEKNPGLLPNILKAVFSSISAARKAGEAGLNAKPPVSDPHVFPMSPDMEYNVWVTYLECYNEKVYDLLRKKEEKVGANGRSVHVPADQSAPVALDIKYSRNNVPLINSTEPAVETLAQAMQWLNHGASNRSTGFTQINKSSSRSHGIFTIKLTQRPKNVSDAELAADPSLVKYSKFTIVDLAGSERSAKSQASGDRLREASNINNSLLTLKRCMKALQQNQMVQNQLNNPTAAATTTTAETAQTEKRLSVTSKRLSTTSSSAKPAPAQPPQLEVVPFRDSILTKLLREYLQGEGKCSVIVTINPSPSEYEESLHALDFGTITKAVKTTTCKKKMMAKSASPPQPIPFSLTHTRSTSKPSLVSKTSHSALNIDKIAAQPLLLSLSQSMNTSTSSQANTSAVPVLARTASSARFDAAVEATSPTRSALNRSRMVLSSAASPAVPATGKQTTNERPMVQDTAVKALFRLEDDEATLPSLNSVLLAANGAPHTPSGLETQEEYEFAEVLEFDQMEMVQEINKLRTEIAEAENRNLEIEMSVRAEVANEMAARLSALDVHYKQHTAKMVRNVEEKYERMLAHFGKIHAEEQESVEQAAAAQEAETHENVYSMLLDKENELEGVRMELSITTQGLQRVSSELARIRDSAQSELEALQDKHREEVCMLRNKMNHTLTELEAVSLKLHQYESGELALPSTSSDAIAASSAASSTQDLDDSTSSASASAKKQKKSTKHKREGTFSEAVAAFFGRASKETKKAAAACTGSEQLNVSHQMDVPQSANEMDTSSAQEASSSSAKEVEEINVDGAAEETTSSVPEKKARNIKKRKGKATAEPATTKTTASNKVSKVAEDTTPTSPLVKSESMFEVPSAALDLEEDYKTAKPQDAASKRRAKHASAQPTTRQPRRMKAFRSVQLEPIVLDDDETAVLEEARSEAEEPTRTADDSVHVAYEEEVEEEQPAKTEDETPRTPLAAAKMLGLKGRKLASPSSPHLALSPPAPAPAKTTRRKKLVTGDDEEEDFEPAEENTVPTNELPTRTPLTKRLRSRRPQDDVVEHYVDSPPAAAAAAAATRKKKEPAAAAPRGTRRRGVVAAPKYLDF